MGLPYDRHVITVKGQLVSEDVECPMFRIEDGINYTLLGDLSGYKVDDQLEITGTFSRISYCMQGVN